jgi:hypothetical protein
MTPRPRFTPGERAPGSHGIGGLVGIRAGLYAEGRGKILCLCRGWNPSRPVRSQSLYWLSYPAHKLRLVSFYKYNLNSGATGFFPNFGSSALLKYTWIHGPSFFIFQFVFCSFGDTHSQFRGHFFNLLSTFLLKLRIISGTVCPNLRFMASSKYNFDLGRISFTSILGSVSLICYFCSVSIGLYSSFGSSVLLKYSIQFCNYWFIVQFGLLSFV